MFFATISVIAMIGQATARPPAYNLLTRVHLPCVPKPVSLILTDPLLSEEQKSRRIIAMLCVGMHWRDVHAICGDGFEMHLMVSSMESRTTITVNRELGIEVWYHDDYMMSARPYTPQSRSLISDDSFVRRLGISIEDTIEMIDRSELRDCTPYGGIWSTGGGTAVTFWLRKDGTLVAEMLPRRTESRTVPSR